MQRTNWEYPITIKHIANQYKHLTGEVPNDPDDIIYRSDKYREARVTAAKEYLDVELDMSNVKIKDVKMASNPESCIMWITTEPYYIKTMFIRARYRKSENIRIMNY